MFIKWLPHVFVSSAHLGGIALSIWMGRWDLLAAGIAFGIPSALLFLDLLPGGPNFTVKFVKRITFLDRKH